MTVELPGSIPVRPGGQTSAPGAVADGLPDTELLSLLIRHSQPLTESQRAGLQRLLQLASAVLLRPGPTATGSQANTSPGSSTGTSALAGALAHALPTAQTNTLLADLPRLAALLAEPSLHLLKAQGPAGELWLLSPKPARPDSPLAVQASALGFRVRAGLTPPASAPATATPPSQTRPATGPIPQQIAPALTAAPPPSASLPAMPPNLQNLANQLHQLGAETAQQQIQQGLRQALPNQQAAHLNLQALQRQGAALATDHPLRQITTTLSDKAALTLPLEVNQLRQQLADSGLFAEKLLGQWLQAGTGSPPQSDTKLLLWQLLNLLKPAGASAEPRWPLTAPNKPTGKVQTAWAGTPADAAEQMKTSAKHWLARLLSLQLGSLSSDASEAGSKLLSFELPLKWDQQLIPLQLQFQRYWAREEPEQEDRSQAPRRCKPQWQLTLNLDIPGKGHLDARVRYADQTLHCSLWAEQPDTLRLIQDSAGQLADGLIRRGLQLSPIQCFPGRLPTAPANHQPLLDTHA